MTSESILISVIMSVYSEKLSWLRLSIESILNQTYSNFEFIIILDNPHNPEMLEFLTCYENSDNRIYLIKNEYNIGLTASLNKGLSIARGEYIARMDGDDISHIRRFEEQLKLIDANTAVIGSQCCIINEAGESITNTKFCVMNNGIKFSLKYMLPSISHPTAIISASILREIGGYDENFIVAQDYNLWCRVQSISKFKNAHESLLLLRKHSNNISFSKQQIVLKNTLISNVLLHAKRTTPLQKNEYEDLGRSIDKNFVFKLLLLLRFKHSFINTFAKLLLSNIVSVIIYLKYVLKKY